LGHCVVIELPWNCKGELSFMFICLRMCICFTVIHGNLLACLVSLIFSVIFFLNLGLTAHSYLKPNPSLHVEHVINYICVCVMN